MDDRRATGVARVLAAVAGVLALGGCATEAPTACTLMGLVPSISVTGVDAVAPDAERVTLTWCADGRADCREAAADVVDGGASVELDELGLDRPGWLVFMGVTFSDGPQLAARVRLHEIEVNGPGCGTDVVGELHLGG